MCESLSCENTRLSTLSLSSEGALIILTEVNVITTYIGSNSGKIYTLNKALDFKRWPNVGWRLAIACKTPFRHDLRVFAMACNGLRSLWSSSILTASRSKYFSQTQVTTGCFQYRLL